MSQLNPNAVSAALPVLACLSDLEESEALASPLARAPDIAALVQGVRVRAGSALLGAHRCPRACPKATRKGRMRDSRPPHETHLRAVPCFGAIHVLPHVWIAPEVPTTYAWARKQLVADAWTT